MGKTFLGFCIGCMFITSIFLYLTSERWDELESAGRATHCNETDCFWSSANLTELGLFDDLASIIANISKNGNDADALELELRNSELERDEPPATDDDESFGVIWPDPIFFGSLQKKSNFKEYFDDDDDDENDDDNDDFYEIEDEYDFESRNLLPPDVVSQNQNPNPVIELDEMIPEFPADLPPIDNQLEINPPNPNTSQAFWGVPKIREPPIKPHQTDQTEPHSREIKSFFPKLPPPFFESQPGRNSAALDSIEISGEANIGRRNPISSQNPPSFPDEDDDEDDESYFGDDSELGEEKPFMNRPKTPEKPGNVPGFLGTAINPKGPQLGFGGKDDTSGPIIRPKPPGGPLKEGPKLPGQFPQPGNRVPVGPNLPPRPGFDDDFLPGPNRPPNLPPRAPESGLAPQQRPQKPPERPLPPPPPKFLGDDTDLSFLNDPDLFPEQSGRNSLGMGTRPSIPGNPFLSHSSSGYQNPRLPQGSLGLQNQGPQGFSQPMSHQMGNRNLVGPPGLVGGRNPRGGDPFGFDDFNDFDDPYDDMMAFGPSKGRDTMGPHKPFGPPGVRGF